MLENTSAQLRALHMFFLLGGHYAPKDQLIQQEATVRAILVGQMDPPPAVINVTPTNGHKKNGDGQ